MDKFEQIKTIIAATEADVVKHEAGNASAGTRVRAAMQEINKLTKDIRKDVQTAKNAVKAEKK